MKQVTAKVIENRQLLESLFRTQRRNITGSWIIWLKCPEIAREARPGQFIMVRCGEDCLLPRPFSVHQVNNKGDVALLFAAWEAGKGTSWLSQRKAGDSIDLFGPLGNGFSIHPASRSLLLVAGGIGIAPLCFLAQKAVSQGHSVRLLSGASTASQLYPRHSLPSQIELTIATEDGTAGRKGMITDLLPDFAGQADQIFACGPVAMYRDMADRHRQLLKDKPVQISLEMRMGCGLGVCYGCTVKVRGGLKQVCSEGPVFDLKDILWDELSTV